MIGKMNPPSPDPAALTPYARPRFFKNHDGSEPIAALKMQLRPSGLQIPCARMK